MRFILALASVVTVTAFCCQAQANANGNISEQFIVNQERAFVYLEFVRIDKGTRFSDDEPQTRIWFRLVNNSRVPIVIRTFGVPDGSSAEEVGVMHDVVEDPPINGMGGVIYAPIQEEKPSETSAVEKMPLGYGGDVSSTATLASSQTLLFSVPINHLSDKWHIEIPFRFALPHKRPAHFDGTIGGQPHMQLSYFLSDLPTGVRKRITGAR